MRRGKRQKRRKAKARRRNKEALLGADICDYAGLTPLLVPNSRALLDAEATRMASTNINPGDLWCKHLKIIMVAPKTHTPAYRGPHTSFDITVYWSPYDAVPNLGLFSYPVESIPYWQGYGTVYTVNPGGFLFGNHPFLGFGHATPITSNPLPPPPFAHGGERLMYSPYVRFSGEFPSIESLVESALAPGSGYDYVWVCHSQGCNIAMHTLNRGEQSP